MLRTNFHTRILLALITLAVTLTPAYSTAITTYSSLSSWQAAASTTQTINFETTTLGTTNGTLTVNGVQFIGYTSVVQSETVADTSLYSWMNFGTGRALDMQIQGSTLPYIRIVLPTMVTAAGFNLFTSGPNALSFSVAVAGSSNTVPTFATPTPAYFGVTSDTPFNTIDLSLPAWSSNLYSWEYVDNVSYGDASTATPEAATCLLIGSGLIGLIVLRRRATRNRLACAT